LEDKAKKIRYKSLMSIYKAGIPSIGNSMSLIEIMVSLYYGDIMKRPIMRTNPGNPGDSDQDYLVLSKGDSVPVQYSILADLGFIDESELDYIGQDASLLKARPSSKVPGISCSVPFDGQGLSIGTGLALSLRCEKKYSNRTFVVMDESELLDGQVWEAAQLAAFHKLDKLIAVVDCPKVNVDTGAINSIKPEKLQDKFEAFGWKVIQITDAHDFDKLVAGFAKAFTTVRRPTCIWCHTVGGKGVEFLERKASYLRAKLSEGEMSEILPKLQNAL
jgi:transketolase